MNNYIWLFVSGVMAGAVFASVLWLKTQVTVVQHYEIAPSGYVEVDDEMACRWEAKLRRVEIRRE